MPVDKQLDKVGKLYTGNLTEKGVSSQAVGWRSEEGQVLRFAKLSQLALADDMPFSVNDYGCGFGSHLLYLHDKGKRVTEYNGYDISSEMLEEADRQLRGVPSTRLNLINEKSISTIADYSFVSGTFNVRFDASKAEWTRYIESKLTEIDQHTQKAFSFNLLTSYVDWEEPHLYYGDPCYWFDFCKRHFSKNVALLHDYAFWEWTIIVDKR